MVDVEAAGAGDVGADFSGICNSRGPGPYRIAPLDGKKLKDF